MRRRIVGRSTANPCPSGISGSVGKSGRIEAGQLRLEGPGADVDPRFLKAEVEGVRRERAGEVEKHLSVDGRSAFPAHHRGALRVDGHVQVGGGEVETITFGREEDVGEDGNGGAALHHSLDELEFLEQERSVECDVHGRNLPASTVRRGNCTSFRGSRRGCGEGWRDPEEAGKSGVDGVEIVERRCGESRICGTGFG